MTINSAHYFGYLSSYAAAVSCHSEHSEESISKAILSNKDSSVTSFPQNDVKRAIFTLGEFFSSRPTCQRKYAFTLAEVLITLGIIGVVAALTLPSLIANHRDKQTVVKLKKLDSVLNQAYLRAVEEHGTPDTWDNGNGYVSAQTVIDNLKPYIQNLQICTSESNNCFGKGTYTYLNGGLWHMNYGSSSSAMKLVKFPDGMSMAIQSYDTSCNYLSNYGGSKALENICTNFHIDINGSQKPNKVGVDWFLVNFTKYGFVPAGTPLQTNGSYSFEEGCAKPTSHGLGCMAWVIYNENLDYLHCSGLSWSGKTKCK